MKNIPCVCETELQVSQRVLLCAEARWLQVPRSPAGSLQRLQLRLYQLRQEAAAEPAELKMRKRRKKAAGALSPRCCHRHCSEFRHCSCIASLSRNRPRTPSVAMLHESSRRVCLDLLAHSCCDLEVHVELRSLPFLQVSSLILHRQGFRAHWAGTLACSDPSPRILISVMPMTDLTNK